MVMDPSFAAMRSREPLIGFGRCELIRQPRAVLAGDGLDRPPARVEIERALRGAIEHQRHCAAKLPRASK